MNKKIKIIKILLITFLIINIILMFWKTCSTLIKNIPKEKNVPSGNLKASIFDRTSVSYNNVLLLIPFFILLFLNIYGLLQNGLLDNTILNIFTTVIIIIITIFTPILIEEQDIIGCHIDGIFDRYITTYIEYPQKEVDQINDKKLFLINKTL